MGKCNCLIPTVLSDPCAKDKLHICRELRQAFASQGMCMILQPNQLLHSKPAAIEGFYVAVAKHFNRMRLAVGGNTYTPVQLGGRRLRRRRQRTVVRWCRKV